MKRRHRFDLHIGPESETDRVMIINLSLSCVFLMFDSALVCILYLLLQSYPHNMKTAEDIIREYMKGSAVLRKGGVCFVQA